MSCCLPSLSAFGVVSVLDFSHSNRCVEVSHCCFNLQFPDDIGYRESFHLFICHLYPFFGEVSVKVFGPSFNWAVCYFNVQFYEFFIYSLQIPYEVYDLQIFSPILWLCSPFDSVL